MFVKASAIKLFLKWRRGVLCKNNTADLLGNQYLFELLQTSLVIKIS